jgi:hypothetical protein
MRVSSLWQPLIPALGCAAQQRCAGSRLRGLLLDGGKEDARTFDMDQERPALIEQKVVLLLVNATALQRR